MHGKKLGAGDSDDEHYFDSDWIFNFKFQISNFETHTVFPTFFVHSTPHSHTKQK